MSDRETERLRRSVAMEIRVLMLRRGVRAVSIAHQMGKSEAYISRRLNGETALDLDDLEAIAAALDVPITDLFPTSGKGVTGRYGEPGHVRADHLAPLAISSVRLPVPVAAG